MGTIVVWIICGYPAPEIERIVPPLGVPLWGYSSRTDPADGVFDSLYAKAIVFDDGYETMQEDGRTVGYNSYFPTIKAASEGGYGADYGTLVEVGTGEHLVNRAIIALYELVGRLEGK